MKQFGETQRTDRLRDDGKFLARQQREHSPASSDEVGCHSPLSVSSRRRRRPDSSTPPMGAICGIIATARFGIRNPTPTSKGINTKTCKLTINQCIRVTTAQPPARITYKQVRRVRSSQVVGVVKSFEFRNMATIVSFGILFMPKKSENAIYYEAVCLTRGFVEFLLLYCRAASVR